MEVGCAFCCERVFENSMIPTYVSRNIDGFYAGYKEEHNDEMIYDYEVMDIKFCPICGRKLNEWD